jgi:chromate transport protein ChrA
VSFTVKNIFVVLVNAVTTLVLQTIITIVQDENNGGQQINLRFTLWNLVAVDVFCAAVLVDQFCFAVYLGLSKDVISRKIKHDT